MTDSPYDNDPRRLMDERDAYQTVLDKLERARNEIVVQIGDLPAGDIFLFLEDAIGAAVGLRDKAQEACDAERKAEQPSPSWE